MSQISDLGTPPPGAHGSPAVLCRTNPPPLQRSSRRIPRRDTRPPRPWQSDPAGWLAHKHRLILQGRNALLKPRGISQDPQTARMCGPCGQNATGNSFTHVLGDLVLPQTR